MTREIAFLKEILKDLEDAEDPDVILYLQEKIKRFLAEVSKPIPQNIRRQECDCTIMACHHYTR